MGSQFNSKQIVRFDASGQPVGTGLALSARHILTCTHVVESVLGESGNLTGKSFAVCLPKFPNVNTAEVRVLIAVARTDEPCIGKPEDIAVLEIISEEGDGPLEFETLSILLLDQDEDRNDHFFTHGYFTDTGSSIRGKCDVISDQGWIEFSEFSLPEDGTLLGLSGAPVWNERVSAFTGMVVAEREGYNRAFMIPFGDVLKVWPEFQQYADRGNYRLISNKSNSKFIQYVKAKIAEELSADDVVAFTDVLRNELNKVLENLDEPGRKVQEHKPKAIAEALVWALANGREQVPVINKVLLNTFHHCFDRRGRKYAVAQPHHEVIKETVGQLLGWLVLASLDEAQIAALTPAPGYGPGIYFELPVKTQCGVEIIVSRQNRRRADLQPDGSEVMGSHVLCASASQFSWQDTATLDDLKRMLWNQVFPEETQDVSLSRNQVERLNAELQTRRLDEWDTEHHYLAIQCDDSPAEQAYLDVYKQLLSELDQLTIVRFGVADKQAVFCMPEYNLMAAISNFLNKVNKIV